MSSTTVEQVITETACQIPTTVARFGNVLAAVTSNFDTGAPPFHVVVVER